MAPKVSEEYKEEKRSELMKSALVCFGEKGFEATTVDDIIRVAGVSKGMLYTYFNSKEEILVELIQQRTSQFIAAIQSELEQIPDFFARMLTLIRRYRETPLSEEQRRWTTVYLEFWLASSRLPSRQTLLQERYDMLNGFLTTVIEEGQHNGVVRQDLDARTASVLYWAVCDGATVHALQSGDEAQARMIWQAAEEMLVKYLSDSSSNS